MHRMVVFLFAACLLPFISAGSEDQSSTATVQRLFDAMSTHDADAARALFIPQASLFSVQPDGTAVAVPYEKWLEHLSASKDSWLERIWNPKVLEHESVAIVWAQYDFHLNGKFSHCGIDSFNLLKTAAGWKIAAVADTHEVSGCSPSPLGPPAK